MTNPTATPVRLGMYRTAGTGAVNGDTWNVSITVVGDHGRIALYQGTNPIFDLVFQVPAGPDALREYVGWSIESLINSGYQFVPPCDTCGAVEAEPCRDPYCEGSLGSAPYCDGLVIASPPYRLVVVEPTADQRRVSEVLERRVNEVAAAA